MQQQQQGVFMNLSRVARYEERSRALTDNKAHYPTFRETEIMNEFEIVDFKGSGRLKKQEIMEYLQDKYAKLNYSILEDLFASMQWTDDEVTKEEFCSKYLQKERALYHEIHHGSSMGTRVRTLRTIFHQTRPLKPAFYAVVKIVRCLVVSERKGKEEKWLNVEAEYEDHDHQLSYTLQQPDYSTEDQSSELLLPVQGDYFFLRYRFSNPKDARETYCQGYLNLPAPSQVDPTRSQRVKVELRKGSEVKGYAEVSVRFETSKQIEVRLNEEEQRLNESWEDQSAKQKQYEYLQFVWGVRHKQPHKIAKVDARWVVAVRLVLMVAIALATCLVHVLGRYEPLGMILALVLGKNWKFVILRVEKFLLGWVCVAALVLDFIWLSFSSEEVSQINYLRSDWTIVFTYALLVAKAVLLVYLLLVEKAFQLTDDEEEEGTSLVAR